MIGGSTIAAAAGIDPYLSRYALWARLKGLVPDDDAERLWWGTHVQPLIFEALKERGYYVADWNHEFTDPERPWLVGHPDGWEYDGGMRRVAVVEAKLTARTDTIPVPWQAQVQTYMRLAQVERAILAVNVGGTRLDVHEIAYDERAAERLVELAEEFMGYVERDEPPPPDGSESTRTALGYVYPKHTPGATYTLTADEWQLAKELRARREQRKAVEEQERELENRLKAAAGDAELILTPHDTTFATWSTVATRRVDVKALRAARPDIAEEFTVETTTRRFAIHD
jgi:predicted phage-related endonuclease